MAIYINRNAPESGIASLLAMQGNRGDTELVHMTKPEVNMLRGTGRMSMNRETGLPQFANGNSIMEKILPALKRLLPNLNTDPGSFRFIIPEGMEEGEYVQPAPEPFYIPEGMEEGEFFGDEYYQPLATGGSVPFEGQIPGPGHGMQDNVHMPIMHRKGGIAAVSPDEYVVPSDVMAMIGNGSADAGAGAMDDFIAKFRTAKYGRPTQPPEIDPRTALQSLMG